MRRDTKKEIRASELGSGLRGKPDRRSCICGVQWSLVEKLRVTRDATCSFSNAVGV